eukprot:6243519-Amphidinium_carterae.1
MSPNIGLHQVPGQPFFLEIFSALAAHIEDPDWQFPLALRDPLPLGVDQPLPPTPGVFRTKRASEESYNTTADQFKPAENYSSAERYEEQLLEGFTQDVREGLMAGPFPDLDSVATFLGCAPTEVITGALAARPEGHKTRPIFDATITLVNEKIRANTPEKTEAPSVADVRHAMALERSQGSTLSGLKLDVSAAHRRIRIRREDWRFLTTKCKDQWFVNLVGTFRVASMQFHWGRVAALLCRLSYHLASRVWAFVYVDDYLFLHPTETAQRDHMIIIVLMLVLNVPISWRKMEHGQQLHWIGVHFNLALWTMEPQADKLPPLLAFLESVEQGRTIHLKPLRHIMGVLSWYTGVVPHLKAFLTPFFAWVSAMKNAGRPSKSSRMRSIGSVWKSHHRMRHGLGLQVAPNTK